VAAFDPDSRKELWRTYSIPAPGEPGSESWPGETRKYGGAVWLTGTYDPELNLMQSQRHELVRTETAGWQGTYPRIGW
jgi:hypothetical protein